jgi:glycosyltransferase involved in cell wall biosynthesis
VDNSGKNILKQGYPVIVIGLPVYNEEQHLREALDSVIGQEYTNWKLLISDNCSGDKTSSICSEYCTYDERIVYTRQSSNLGGAENFHLVAKMAKETNCDYFMFLRGDAVLSHDYLKSLVESLEQSPEASLAYSEMVWIDMNSAAIKDKPEAYYNSIGLSISQRIAVLLWTRPNQLYGVMRGEHIRKIADESWWQTIGVDHVLLMELALRGGFRFNDGPTFYRRYNYAGETYRMRMKRYKFSLFKKNTSAISGGILSRLSILKLPLSLVKVVVGSGLLLKDKLHIIIIIVFTAPLRYMDARDRGV